MKIKNNKNSSDENKSKTSYSTFEQLWREFRRGSDRRAVPSSVLHDRLTGGGGQRGGPGNVSHDRTPGLADARLTRVQAVGYAQRPANARLVPVHLVGRVLHAPANQCHSGVCLVMLRGACTAGPISAVFCTNLRERPANIRNCMGKHFFEKTYDFL